MTIKSLDPRVNRTSINEVSENNEISQLDFNATFEVFVQVKRGVHHQHVGSVHAANPQLAILFAKEQFSRRGECVNIWVVKTTDIEATAYEDSDIFETTKDKIHRNPESYKVMDKIQEFKNRNKNNGVNG